MVKCQKYLLKQDECISGSINFPLMKFYTAKLDCGAMKVPKNAMHISSRTFCWH